MEIFFSILYLCVGVCPAVFLFFVHVLFFFLLLLLLKLLDKVSTLFLRKPQMQYDL